MEFVRRSHERCDDIEQAAKTIGGLKEDFAGLQTRLEPQAAAQDGIRRRVKDLDDAKERLATEIAALQQTPQGSLAERVQAFAEDKKKLEDGVANLEMQLSRLASLRKDVECVSANFDRALDLVSNSGAGDAEGRLAELSQFAKATQARLDEIERSMATVGQLQVRLGDLQSRLVPLEASDGGAADLIAKVAAIRDSLVAKIESIEADENGDLATRVNTFIETKKELESRVATVTEQFSKLATIRSDIAGLFDKLSNAADTSSN
jgi:chromosome segregation ATPase